MTWFPDLSPCSYFGDEYAAGLLAVGWLEGDHDYQRGDVPTEVTARLSDFFENLWVPFAFCGYHSCSLCTSAGPRGVHNLFVPGRGFLYVAPALILHYIAAHRYAPPSDFQAAILACPAMKSDAYLELVYANAPAGLIEKRPAD